MILGEGGWGLTRPAGLALRAAESGLSRSARLTRPAGLALLGLGFFLGVIQLRWCGVESGFELEWRLCEFPGW
jgi:hypothetical protein